VRVRVSTWNNFVGTGPVYRPTVEFTATEGTQVTATSPGHVGDTVTVLYDPRDPQRIRVETQSRWVGCLELGLMLFGGGVGSARDRQPHRQPLTQPGSAGASVRVHNSQNRPHGTPDRQHKTIWRLLSGLGCRYWPVPHDAFVGLIAVRVAPRAASTTA
jgi:hypothetical protein